MPKYVYYCAACEKEFMKVHGLGKTLQICELCHSTNELVRRPSAVFLNKKSDQFQHKNQPGTLVKQTIEEASQELRKEQERLAKREYDNGK